MCRGLRQTFCKSHLEAKGGEEGKVCEGGGGGAFDCPNSPPPSPPQGLTCGPILLVHVQGGMEPPAGAV